MTRKRTGEPWQTPAAYGRTLAGLTVNLIVRDVARSIPFYTDVLGFKALYGDEDYAALERDGMRLQLHADHAYDGMPWAQELAAGGPRLRRSSRCRCHSVPSRSRCRHMPSSWSRRRSAVLRRRASVCTSWRASSACPCLRAELQASSGFWVRRAGISRALSWPHSWSGCSRSAVGSATR